jgi:hypothetical protein
MNRDRQKRVDALAGSLDDDMDREERAAARAELRALIVLESEAVRKMEPHATMPNTAANYNKARVALAGLEEALEAMIRRDIGEAQAALADLSGLSVRRKTLAFAPAEEKWYEA